MSVIWPWGKKRRDAEIARLAGSAATKCQPVLERGFNMNGAIVFKANIGHGTVRLVATLHAIVVADSPEEAGEMLLEWAKGDATMYGFISRGEFILEEIVPVRKGVY